MVLNVHKKNIRHIRDGEKRTVWRWGKREIIIIPVATLSPTGMTSALRWAAMRAIL